MLWYQMLLLPAARCLTPRLLLRGLPASTLSRRCCSKRAAHKTSSHLVTGSPEPQQLTLGQKVKETGKDATYMGIILAGVGVTGCIFYALWKELMSSEGYNAIYSKSWKRVKQDPRVGDILGTPIRAHGEETARGRRRHVSHVTYEKDGAKFLRMKFYLKGSQDSATVQLEMKQDESGKFAYRYLFVETDSFPRRTLIIEDNRQALDSAPLNN